MNRTSIVFALAGVLAVMMSPVAKAQLVYDNGPINGTLVGWTIDGGYYVSDSFTVSSATSLASATAGIWNYSGDYLTQLGWAIGTTPYASDVASGVAATTDTLQYNNGQGFDVYSDSLAISGSVVPGTYWFTLQNGVSAEGYFVYWDVNNGPSVAYENTVGNVNGNQFPGSNSTSFQLYGSGTPAGTPEPGAVAMVAGLWLSSLAILRRRHHAS